jgi:hypothetical protein
MVFMKFVTYRLVLFGLELNVRQEVPEHFVFDYKNADWALFGREMDSRMDLHFSLDRIGSGVDVDSMIRTFTQAIRQAGRFCLVLSPENWLVACGAE